MERACVAAREVERWMGRARGSGSGVGAGGTGAGDLLVQYQGERVGMRVLAWQADAVRDLPTPVPRTQEVIPLTTQGRMRLPWEGV